ncbi:MAG: sugar phosphate nucleotidyltransferase [Cyclobacteriaceae bacterium]|nr:sugar phosphate nucleotidyltransferase [Cyclobacteriaceae bacterium]
MNIIIPMAGMGKRLRPHTLTTPKPLIPIVGKPIVYWLVHDIVEVCAEKVDNIGFVIGKNFDVEVEKELLAIASKLGATGHLYYQDEPLGTAHAIYCAAELMNGKTIVAFADTLFKANFKLDSSQDGIIWVHRVEDPSAFGVVKLNDSGEITDFVEKPKHFVSNLAIIGIYYFKNGENLRNEIKVLMDNKIKDGGEYQLTRVLDTLKEKGLKFVPGQVDDWLDCGNKQATVETHRSYFNFMKEKRIISPTARTLNSVMIEPVFLGENVEIENAVIGPYVSVGDNSKISESRIQNSIIQKDSQIKNANLANSMLGNFVTFEGKATDLSVGDYNTITQF